MRELAPLPPAHLSAQDAVDSLLESVGPYATREQGSTFRAIVRAAYDLGYQAAVLEIQARAVEHGATGGGKRSPAQRKQTARLNGTLTPSATPTSTPRMAPGSPWTADEDAAVLRGEFPETHTRGACYARRSRLKRAPLSLT